MHAVVESTTELVVVSSGRFICLERYANTVSQNAKINQLYRCVVDVMKVKAKLEHTCGI